MNWLLKNLVRFYQLVVSPIITVIFGQRCRFYPSCSHYALATLEREPAHLAIKKVGNRLCKCGPWHPGGIDLP